MKGTWLAPVAIAVPAFLAAWIVWQATAQGVTFTPDGITYLEAARSFGRENRLWMLTDCGLSHDWLNYLGPWYPALLGSGMKVGLEPFAWTRALNILCAVIATASAAWGALRISGSAVAAALAGCAIALLPASTASYRAMLSEPPYLALVLLGWLALSIGTSGGPAWTVRAAAVAFGLAAATRYAALPLPFAAAVFLWWTMRRLRPAIEFVAVALIPTILFAAVRLRFSGSEPPREFAFHPPRWSDLAETVKTLVGWLGVHVSATWGAILLAVLLGSLILLLALPGKLASGAGLALLLLSTHLIAILGAKTFFDTSIEIQLPRQLLLLFPLGVLALCGALQPRLLIAALAMLAAIHVRAGLHPQPVQAMYNSNSPEWRDSETLARIGEITPAACVYTNAPDVVYRRYEQHAEWLPQPTAWFTGHAMPWCDIAKKDLARHPRSVYVFFDAHLTSSPSVSEAELTGCLTRLTRVRLRDGTILLPEPGS